MNPQLIADAYIETWNESNADQRRSLLARHWSTQASYVDPLMQASGAEQIAGLVEAVKARFPEFRFQLRGTPNGHGDYVRLAWALGAPGQEAPIEGSDLVELQDGRTSRVIGFIDKAPAA